MIKLYMSAFDNQARKRDDADFTTAIGTGICSQELHSQVDFNISYTALV